MNPTPTRSQLTDQYLAQLPYAPYPVQEDALLAWFTTDQGVLVCAPTGTGKTLIAQAALYEALHTGTVAYYTTPLIALTEQKFQEMQDCAERWGFSRQDVGLVTGNRRVNPEARVLIVVAEILLNRLLHPQAFDFERVSAVVMDEFHSFADPERGIVWELTLSLLPRQARLLLLSATVGNAMEFVHWLERCHGRKVELVEGRERKVPLSYHWIGDEFLGDHLVEMAKGDPAARRTPALVFCFNRDECWSYAEQFKGLKLLNEDQRGQLLQEVHRLDWTQGVGPKLKQILQRGVGVHHAGMLPKYRRVVESLFERKLLSVVLCTETLAAGINLPARSVVLSSLVKGPFGKQKLVDASTAQQIFGRAGRPQYDDRGYVYALAHDDDVKIGRWKEKYDAIPENTKDPGLLRAKKDLKRKKPSRREHQLYWNEAQFKQLQGAPPGRLYSKGFLPWRLLAYLLTISPDVSKVRGVIRKRLLDPPRIAAQEKALDQMLVTLARAGFAVIEPDPRASEEPVVIEQAHATPELAKLFVFRGVHPLYAVFALSRMAQADPTERLQLLESMLELPRPILRHVRVPRDLPPGPLANEHLDAELVRKGLIAAKIVSSDDEEEDAEPGWREEEEYPPSLAEKLFLLYEFEYPEVTDARVQTIWCANELVRFGGDFNKYVQSRDLVKQEGIVFRHLLRLILLCGEFAQVCPPDTDPDAWRGELKDLSDQLTAACRSVDPASTDEIIEHAHAADIVEGEATPATGAT